MDFERLNMSDLAWAGVSNTLLSEPSYKVCTVIFVLIKQIMAFQKRYTL